VTVLIPFEEGQLVSMLHEKGRVLATVYEESGARIQALVGDEVLADLQPYLV
jgi:GTPase